VFWILHHILEEVRIFGQNGSSDSDRPVLADEGHVLEGRHVFERGDAFEEAVHSHDLTEFGHSVFFFKDKNASMFRSINEKELIERYILNFYNALLWKITVII
jgi:hypothetical protein